jgi:hypothetical protein
MSNIEVSTWVFVFNKTDCHHEKSPGRAGYLLEMTE